jgi:hypothetical protein
LRLVVDGDLPRRVKVLDLIDELGEPVAGLLGVAALERLVDLIELLQELVLRVLLDGRARDARLEIGEG